MGAAGGVGGTGGAIHAKSSLDASLPALRRHGQRDPLAAADHNHWHLPADRRVLYETGELSHAADALAIELDDLVAVLEAGLRRRASAS